MLNPPHLDADATKTEQSSNGCLARRCASGSTTCCVIPGRRLRRLIPTWAMADPYLSSKIVAMANVTQGHGKAPICSLHWALQTLGTATPTCSC